MKRTYLAGVAVAVIIVLVVVALVSQPSGGTTYRVGAIFTLTGNTAYWSVQLKKGMELALEEENVKGQPPIQVIYEDAQAQARLAVTAFQKLVDVDKVSVLLTVFTPVSQPLRPMAVQAKVPLLASVTSIRDFAKGYEWVFRDHLIQDQMAGTIGEYSADKLKLKSAAGLVVNDDYGLDGASAFKASFEERGGKWIGQETFEQKDVDTRAQATKIAFLKPEVVLCIGRDQSLGIAIKQLYEAGFRGRIVSVNCLDTPVVWEIAGPAIENAEFVTAYMDFAGNPATRAFREKYQARYKEEPDYVTVYGYSIMKYLMPIIRNAKGDRALIRDALEHLNVQSIRGQLKMNENHDVLSPVAIYRVSKGRTEFVEVPARWRYLVENQTVNIGGLTSEK